jgi:hypothetical protein
MDVNVSETAIVSGADVYVLGRKGKDGREWEINQDTQTWRFKDEGGEWIVTDERAIPVSVKTVSMDESGHLLVTTTDNETIDVGYIKGPEGPPMRYEDLTNQQKEELAQHVTLQGGRIQALAPGELPAGPAGQTRYMKVTAVGTWTYGGTPIGTNADGYQTTFWWNGTAWSNNGSVRVKGDTGTTNEPYNPTRSGGYASGDVIVENGITYQVKIGQNLPPGQSPSGNLTKVDIIKVTDSIAQNRINELENTIDVLESYIESKEEYLDPLLVNNIIHTIVSYTPDNPNNIITVLGTSGSELTADFSTWGVSKKFAATVEFEDNTFENVLIISFTSTKAIASKIFTKNVVKISCVHDIGLGQHLSDLGNKELGYRLYNVNHRHAFRNVVKSIDFSNHTISSGVITNTSTSQAVLTLRSLGSYPLAWIGIGAETVDYFSTVTPKLNLVASSTVGQGFEFDFSSSYKGWFEMYVGCREIGGVFGEIKVQLVNKSNSAVLKEYIVKGETKRLIFDHTRGEYIVKVTVASAVSTRIDISGMYWLKKREMPTQSIFKPTDVVLFLTDSWGVFPPTSDTVQQSILFDGTKSNGKGYMPLEFKKWFVANGGNPNNVKLCTRGGMTTVWAKYWIDNVVTQTNPSKIVFHFGINDHNSISFHSNPENNYKFDPTNIWGTKNISEGGIVGSIPNQQAYKMNIQWLKNYCQSKGITPIFISPPKTASGGQAQALANLTRDVFLKDL